MPDVRSPLTLGLLMNEADNVELEEKFAIALETNSRSSETRARFGVRLYPWILVANDRECVSFLHVIQRSLLINIGGR